MKVQPRSLWPKTFESPFLSFPTPSALRSPNTAAAMADEPVEGLWLIFARFGGCCLRTASITLHIQ